MGAKTGLRARFDGLEAASVRLTASPSPYEQPGPTQIKGLGRGFIFTISLDSHRTHNRHRGPSPQSVEGPTMMPQQPAGNPGGGAFSSRLAKVKLPLRRVLLLQASLSSQLVAIKDQHYDLMHDSGRHDSPEMVAKRRALHRHPDILSHLWAWWEAAADEYDVDNSGVLEHNECVLTSVIALHYTYCKYSQ